VYDSTANGLAMLVTPNGHRAFYYARRIDGRYHRIKIGDYPDTTIEQARRQTAKLAGQVVEGKNPAEQRRAKRGEMTFADLFSHYLEHHAKPKKKTWAEDEQKYRDHLKPLHNRKLSAIRRADVQAIVTKLGTNKDNPRPGAANRLAALVSAVFNVGIDDLDLPIANPARGIRRFAEIQRERFLNADELQRFYEALEHEPQIFQDFFELLLLTGARSGNVKKMRWEQLDLADAVWTIPASEAKGRRQIVVPLAGRAVEILTRRQDDAKGEPEPNPWVFPSHRRNAKHPHLSEPKTAWQRIIKRAKLKDVRIHDLRHTNATWQGKTGATLTTIGKSLGHRRPTTTLIYTQTELEQVRQSIDAAADAMTGTAKGGK